MIIFSFLALAYPQGIVSPDEDDLMSDDTEIPAEEIPPEEEEPHEQEIEDLDEPEIELTEESPPLPEEDFTPVEEDTGIVEEVEDEHFPEAARSSMPMDTLASYPAESPPVVALDTIEAFSWLPKPQLPPLRLIDSPLNPNLTTDKRVNRQIRTTNPFLVQIAHPRLLNSKGYALRYGFERWYLYIIVSEEIRIAGKPLRCQGLPVYMAIVSPLRKLQELPPVLESSALMLKGIVDYGDTIIQYFHREAQRLLVQRDSLKALPPPDEIGAEDLNELIQKTQDSLMYAEVYRNLYCHFQKAKGSPKKMVRFFLSFPFNRTLTYSIYSAPYALPRYLPPENQPASLTASPLSQE